MNTNKINEFDDETLVRRVQEEEDMYAFEMLVKRYQDKVYGICFRFIGEHHEAFDCTQDTFVKIYQKIHSFKHLSSFGTWVYRIAVNTCKNRLSCWDFMRKKKTMYLGNSGANIENHFISPAQQYEKTRISEIVQNAISKLPFDQKQIVILRDIQQLSYEEIEKITNLPLGTVKSKLSRARSKLKELLKDIKHEL
ncbi:MAG TPA: sigma-70 family RNA polymerase sigma factor [bacterium]|nr:sigma-70 family RNA polymerase sigma factor [bacterium]HPP07610.1 sigma-70 family RNA polymerase sigma factor [bacterium]